MELVILFPVNSSLEDNNLLVRKNDNGRYSKISDPDDLSHALHQLSLEDSSVDPKVLRGTIVTALDLKGLRVAAYPFIVEVIDPSKAILQVNPNCCVWWSAATDNRNISTIVESKHDKENQMILFEADDPMQVASDFNIEETDPKKVFVHIFSIDSKGKCSFDQRLTLNAYKGCYDSDSEKNCSFFLINEDGARSLDLSHNGSINEIKNRKKTFATVIVQEKVISESSSTAEKETEKDHIVHNAYKAAFDSKLVGKVDADKMRLIAAIRNVNQNVGNHNLYSPTVSICQGSGSGKSKLACSLDSDLACAYAVCRETGELAYPEKSSLGDSLMNCSLSLNQNTFQCDDLSQTNIGTYVHLIYAIATDYLTRVKELKSKMNISEKITPSQSKEIRQTIMQEFVDGSFTGVELNNFNNGITLAKLFEGSKDSLKFQKFASIIESCTDSISEELNISDSPLVIILDEVHLLSTFDKKLKTSRLKLLRRAMHALGTKSGVVFLTLGTKADYADLNPIIGTDSLRDDKRSVLYPPFILSRNTDIFRDQVSKLQMSADVLKDPRMLLVRFAMGRPVWCSMAISEVVRMAGVKLVNSSLESGEALVACWILRTGIPASPHLIDTSRHLVKSNMATLLDIHPTLPLMSVCYPSEPALAMAAQNIVQANLIQYFQKLRTHLACKGFDRGDLAETIAAEICLQAIYKARRVPINTNGVCKELDKVEFAQAKKFILESQIDSETLKRKLEKYNIVDITVSSEARREMKLTTLENFLKKLYGNHYASLKLEESISRRMLNGIVDFNHFIRLNKGFPLTDLFKNDELKGNDKNAKYAFPKAADGNIKMNCRGICNLGLKRGAAFFTHEDHAGTDLMIPICLEDSGPEQRTTTATAKPVESEKRPSTSVSYAQSSSPSNTKQKAASSSPSNTKQKAASSSPPNTKKKAPSSSPPSTLQNTSTTTRPKKPTLAMLMIQVKSGSLKESGRKDCARRLLMDRIHNYLKCSKNRNCTGCDECESRKNVEFLKKNQLALVFSFGPKDPKIAPIVKEEFSDSSISNSKITVIFNNGPEYLKDLWGPNFTKITEIIDDILAFSWLPHNYINQESKTGPYHLNQLLESYLDKPLFPEFSDLFREELGWPNIVNPKEDEKEYQFIIDYMNPKKPQN